MVTKILTCQPLTFQIDLYGAFDLIVLHSQLKITVKCLLRVLIHICCMQHAVKKKNSMKKRKTDGEKTKMMQNISQKYPNKMNIKSYPNDICNSWKWCKKCFFSSSDTAHKCAGKRFRISLNYTLYRTNTVVFVSRRMIQLIFCLFCCCCCCFSLHVRQAPTDSLSFRV